MTSRYDSRQKGRNRASIYKRLLKNRNTKSIVQYFTPKLKYPSNDELSELQTVDLIWSQGDRFYKLANTYYGDPELWWVIAWFNQAPTESHFQLGDTISVPLPLDRILDFYDV
jgi:hypothetical protein